MNITNQLEIQQEAIRLQSAIKTFFDNFSVGTLLNRSGIKKFRGVSVRSNSSKSNGLKSRLGSCPYALVV
jgi:hypothetical protein